MLYEHVCLLFYDNHFNCLIMNNIGPLLRQLVVAVSPQLAAFSVGGSVVFPTLLLQQLKDKHSPIQVDMDTSSWIGAIYGLAGIPVIFLPMLMQWRGRKFGYIITCLFVITGWLLAVTAVNIEMLLTSEAFHGLGTNSLMPVSFLSVTEMLAPKYRFLSMQIFGFTLALGMTAGGILGRFLHYKTVSLIMLVPVTIALVIGFAWPDSPPWLACKGEFEKCERAFQWLRGSDDESNKELRELVAAQRENLSQNKYKEKFTIKGFWNQVTSRDFYVPASHIFLLMNMLYWSGGDAVTIYFIEIVEKSSNIKDASFYASIVMYSIITIGSVITNILIRRFKHKSVLLGSTTGVIFSLISIAIIAYLQSREILSKESLLCTYFLIIYMIFNNLGLNAIVFYISAELMPVRHRSVGGALYIVCNCGLYASTLKASPYLLRHGGMWRTFLLFAANASLCALLVRRLVPETKGRTLQDIDDYYTYGSFQRTRDCSGNGLIDNTNLN